MSLKIIPQIPEYGKEIDLNKNQAEAQKVAPKNEITRDLFLPVVYGFMSLEPIKMFETLTDNNNELAVVYAISESTITSVFSISIDGYTLDLQRIVQDADDTVIRQGVVYDIYKGTQNAMNKPFAGAFEFEVQYGGGASTILNGISALTNNNITFSPSNMSYIVIKYIKGSNGIWNQGGVPNIRLQVVGKTLPPIGNKSGTKAFSNNPARVIHDLLTNDTYGLGLGNSDINSASFTSAETYFNTTTEIVRKNIIRQFQLDGLLDTKQSIRSNLAKMLETFNCSLPFIGGQFHLIAEQGNYTSSVYDFDNDSIIGLLEAIYSGASEKPNKINVTINDRNNNGVETTYVIPDDNVGDSSQSGYESGSVTAATYLTQDGSRLFEKNVKFDFCVHAHIAMNLAEIQLNKLRNKINLRWRAKPDSYKVQVGDYVRITNDLLNFSNQVVRITKTTFDVASGIVSFEGHTHDNDWYDYLLKRDEIIYPEPRKPSLPGATEPIEKPPIIDPPTDDTPPTPGDPGAPIFNPPGQPGGEEGFNYTFASANVMFSGPEANRFYLGSWIPNLSSRDLNASDDTGALIGLYDPNRGNFASDSIFYTEALCGVYINIFDRKYDADKEPLELFYAIQGPGGWWGAQYTLYDGRKRTFAYDPEFDNNQYLIVDPDNPPQNPTLFYDGWENNVFFAYGNRLFHQGNGNYRSPITPLYGNWDSSPPVQYVTEIGSFNANPNNPSINGITWVNQYIGDVQANKLGIAIYGRDKVNNVARFYGKFYMNMGIDQITINVEQNRRIYRRIVGDGPTDTSVTPPF